MLLNKSILLSLLALSQILLGCDSSSDNKSELSNYDGSYSFKNITTSNVSYYSSGLLLKTASMPDTLLTSVLNDINLAYKTIPRITIVGDSFKLTSLSLDTNRIKAGLITELSNGYEFTISKQFPCNNIDSKGNPTFSSCFTGNRESIQAIQCIEIVFDKLSGRVDFPYENHTGFTNYVGLLCGSLPINSLEDNFRFELTTTYVRD